MLQLPQTDLGLQWACLYIMILNPCSVEFQFPTLSMVLDTAFVVNCPHTREPTRKRKVHIRIGLLDPYEAHCAVIGMSEKRQYYEDRSRPICNKAARLV